MSSFQKDMTGIVESVQAADSGSFAGAARALNLTPAAVSKNVARLEARLKVRLFNRTTRHFSMTEEGRRFVAQARGGLELLNDASAQAVLNTDPEGLVRVSCGISFGQRFIVPLLAEFFTTYPNIRLELSLSDSQIDLVREGFDVGIRGGTTPPEGMISRRISKISTLLVASAQYLRDFGVPASWKELKNHKIIEIQFQSRAVWPWQFRQGGRTFTLAPRTSLILSEPSTVVQAALHHLGIGQVTHQHAWEHLENGTLQRVLAREHVSSELELAIYYPHRRGMAPRVRAYVEFMLEKLAEHPALKIGHRRHLERR